MEAPPYSPTASGSERRLPNDYLPVQREEEGADPLQSLSRRQRKSISRPAASPRPAHARLSLQAPPASSSSIGNGELRPIATAPATTTEFQDSFISYDHPPEYAPVDQLARSFRLEAPFIYTTRTSSLPRYQLMQEFTRSGRPSKLSIRRLMATESRSNSLPSSGYSAPRIRYDEEATMYTLSCYDLAGLGYRTYEMRGHRSSTLPGNIKLEVGKSLLGARWCKIWHLTKNSRKDSLNPENEARMQRHGYHGKEEWNKDLLFHVKKGEWVDSQGREVGRETIKHEFEMSYEMGVEGWRRDLVVSCWIMKIWAESGLRWDNDVKGC